MKDALISGLFGTGQGLISGIASGITARKQYQGQKKLMDYQNKYNSMMWERQNAYNSPENQRNLLRRAGMNPDLAYGNLASSAAGAPQAAAGMDIPQADYSGAISSAFDAASNLPATIMAYRKTREDIKAQQIDNQFKVAHNLADLRKKAEDTHNVKLKNEIDKIELSWSERMHKQAYEMNEQDKEGKKIENNIKAEQYIQEQYKSYVSYVDAANYSEKVKLQLQSMTKQILMQSRQIKMSDKQYEMLTAQLKILGPELLSAEGQSKMRKWIEENIGQYATSMLYGLMNHAKSILNAGANLIM